MKAQDLDRLQRLSELRTSGALTDDEFDAEKRKVLAARSSRWPIFASAGMVALVAAGVASLSIMRDDPPTTTSLPSGPPVTVDTPAPLAAPVPPQRTPAERIAQAFEAATGHRKPFVQTVKGEAFTNTPIKIVDLPFGPALIVKREIKDGCHACTGYLGVYYLREDPGQTVITASFPDAISGWGWGAAPVEWQITDRFTANPAIYASGGYTGQGITMSGAAITELRPDGPRTSDVIGTGYSDAGAITDEDPRPGCDIDGKISNVVKDRSFDVVVTGTINGKDRYVKRNGKFVAINKRDWGLPCPSA
jgi:hypothetical protein